MHNLYANSFLTNNDIVNEYIFISAECHPYWLQVPLQLVMKNRQNRWTNADTSWGTSEALQTNSSKTMGSQGRMTFLYMLRCTCYVSVCTPWSTCANGCA